MRKDAMTTVVKGARVLICTAAVGCLSFPGPEDTGERYVCTSDLHCIAGYACGGGVCAPGAPRTCDDGEGCTTDTCDSASGCVFTPITGPCDDGDACTVGDTCGGGVCVPGSPRSCNDGERCTTDTCDPDQGCVFSPNSLSCSDGDACTEGDTCAGGTCQSGTVDACDPPRVALPPGSLR